MKKVIFMALASGLFAFTSCSSDDDGDATSSKCRTCTVDSEGSGTVTEYCDNGDGTYTKTQAGAVITEDIPAGVTFSQFIASQVGIWADCE